MVYTLHNYPNLCRHQKPGIRQIPLTISSSFHVYVIPETLSVCRLRWLRPYAKGALIVALIVRSNLLYGRALGGGWRHYHMVSPLSSCAWYKTCGCCASVWQHWSSIHMTVPARPGKSADQVCRVSGMKTCGTGHTTVDNCHVTGGTVMGSRDLNKPYSVIVYRFHGCWNGHENGCYEQPMYSLHVGHLLTILLFHVLIETFARCKFYTSVKKFKSCAKFVCKCTVGILKCQLIIYYYNQRFLNVSYLNRRYKWTLDEMHENYRSRLVSFVLVVCSCVHVCREDDPSYYWRKDAERFYIWTNEVFPKVINICPKMKFLDYI